MIIIDQWNQTMRLYNIQVTIIYSLTILATVMLQCCEKRVICKTWTGALANSADMDQMPQNMTYD